MQPFLRRLVLALLLGVAVYGAFVLYTGYQKLARPSAPTNVHQE